MNQFIVRKGVFFIAIGLSLLGHPSVARTLEPSKKTQHAEQFSDNELKAFVKAYVESHKIRQRYEPALKKGKVMKSLDGSGTRPTQR